MIYKGPEKDRLIHPQTISTSSKDIISVTNKVITNEKRKGSRILYCGPNFSSQGMVLFRLIEISRGSNFLEKTVFNYGDKSIHSKLIYLQNLSFHKIPDAETFEHKRIYRTSIESLSSVSLYRGTSNGHIRTNVIFDQRDNCALGILDNFFTYWNLRSYYKK